MNAETMARVNNWFLSGRVGLSSKTMISVFLGIPTEGHYPHDPADFLRCKKLLEAVPEVRGSFPEISKISDEWKALIEEWDDIDQTLDREMAQGDTAPETFKMMQELTGW
jgi:hypothetical protein